ncbi:MAG: PAS domain S-box protein [Thermodesulfobacteriota bacterium]
MDKRLKYAELAERVRTLEQENLGLRTVTDNVPALVSYVDREGCYRFVNRRYEEWFGLAPTEVIGKHFTEVVGPDAGGRVKIYVEKALSGERVSYEQALPYAHGGERWVHAEYVPDTDDEGTVKGFFALVTDITGRKEAEERARNRTRSLEFLNATAMDFAQFPREELIYEFIGLKLRDLLVDSLVVVNSYESASDALCVRAVAGLGEESDRVQGLLGGNPVGMCFRIGDREGREELLRGRLVEVPTGIRGLSFGELPEEICKNIEDLLGLRKIYGCGFTYKRELLGSAIILSRKEHPFKDRDTVEAFIRQAAMALQKKAAETELVTMRNLLETILSGLDEVVLLVDPNTRTIRYCNEAIERVFGYTRSEAVGRNTRFLHVDDETYDWFGRTVASAVEAGGRCSVEFLQRRKDGTVFLSDHTVKEVRTGTGKSGVGVSVVRDVTERRRMEEALRLSEEKYRQLFEMTSDACFLVDEESKRIIDCNASAEKLYGYSKEELMSMHAPDLSAEPEKTAEAIRGKFPFIPLRWHRRKDGTLVPVEIAKNRFVLHDRRVVVSAERDISIRVKAEEAMRKSEEQYRKLFEGALDGIALADVDTGVIIDCNAALLAMVERERDEVVGKPQTILHPPEDYLGKFSRTFLEHRGSRQGQLIATKLITKTGKLKDVEINADLNEIGTRKILQGIFRDVTARVKAEREREEIQSQLFQSQKMETLGTLVAGVAHEINNPINLIMLNVSLLQKIWRDLDPVLEKQASLEPSRTYGGLTYEFLNQDLAWLLHDMEMATNRVASVVRGLKDYSRKSDLLHKQSMDLNEAVRNTLRLAQTTLRKTGIQVDIELTEGLPSINGNLQAIEQVILNLVTNATQAIKHPAGEIALHTGLSRAKDRVYLTVRDNGKGIDPLIWDKIFDPFFTDRQADGGTGLGLAVSYSLVKAHGGEITFESEVGKGTTFRVCFPIEAAKKPLRILAVDDDAPFLAMIKDAFARDPGYELETAPSGIEALLKMGSAPPDLLILDLNMPDMDGLEVCRALKRKPEFSQLQVVIVTGFAEDSRLEEIESLGITRVFEKPLRLVEFMKAVQEIMEKGGG